MAQVKVEKNVYFQQTEKDMVQGVFVNSEFVKVKVDRFLTDNELLELGNKLFTVCMEIPSIKEVVEKYKEIANDKSSEHNRYL